MPNSNSNSSGGSSFGTEGASHLQRLMATVPEIVEGVFLPPLRAHVEKLKRRPCRKHTVILKGYGKTINFLEGSLRLSDLVPSPDPALPEDPPRQPLTMSERLMEIGARARQEDEDLNKPIDIEGIFTEEEREASERSRRINRSTASLGNLLGELLEDLAKDRRDTFFSSDRGDTLGKLDQKAMPVLKDPRELVKDGEGEAFDTLYLILCSYSVILPSGDLVRRDFRINGIGAHKEHPQIANIDQNLKIRSKKVFKPRECLFYAKAFTVKEGDRIDGYLRTEGKDLPEYACTFVIRGGQLVKL